MFGGRGNALASFIFGLVRLLLAGDRKLFWRNIIDDSAKIALKSQYCGP